MLTAGDAVHHLGERGVLVEVGLPGGGDPVGNPRGHGRSFSLPSVSGPGYFLKRGLGEQGSASIAHEAAVYRALALEPAVGGMLPQFVDYDACKHILVVELVQGEDMTAHHRRLGRLPAESGERLGRALAALHGQRSVSALPASPTMPWGLCLHRPALEMLAELSAGCLAMIRVVQGVSEIGRRLDELAAPGWAECVTHGDVRWSNVMLLPTGPGEASPRIVLVDWEAAGHGDPAWDVGSALSEYLSVWLFSIPASARGTSVEIANQARYPFAAVQEAIRACWGGYVGALADAGDVQRLLTRVVSFTAVGLLQRAFEFLQNLDRLMSGVVLHLQMAHNILDRPLAAAGELLGLDASGRPGPP
jgi:phosphotransferase family enzyme